MKESVSAQAINTRHEAWKARLPNDEKDLWDTLTALDATAQAALFARCASFAVNALCEPANRYNRGRVPARGVARRLEQFDMLGRAVGLDMVQSGWKPTVDNHLGRVTKPRILEAVREAKGEASAQLIDHLRKADMAREALQGHGPNSLPMMRMASIPNQSAATERSLPSRHWTQKNGTLPKTRN